MKPLALSDHPFEPLEPEDPPEIGGYRMVARLGTGGMGRVYMATTQSGRWLAIKVIRPEFADDGEFRRRFEQEVTAAQRVQSLFTAPVIDAELEGPRPWMATAYVPGPSLARAVALHGPMPDDTVQSLLIGMAEALRAIHGARIVHRDLKPSNVLLAEDGPRVIDFGIARAADTTPLTRTGMRIGSPQFMAPEQALGHDCTTAVDCFALGSVIFFAATGRTPFGEGPDTAVLFRIAHEEPNLDGCPESLRDLVRRCLNKNPEERPDAAAILAELRPEADARSGGWLPDNVTRRLPAYAAPPPPTRPLASGGIAPPSPTGTPPPHPRAAALPPPMPAPPGESPPQRPLAAGMPPWGMPPRPQPITPPGGPLPPGNRLRRSTSVKVALGGIAALAVVVLIVDIGIRLASTATGHRERASTSAVPGDGGTNGTWENDRRVGAELGRYKDINLSRYYSIRFANDPKHPTPTKGTSGGDLSYDGLSLWGAQLSVLSPGQPGNYVNCRDSTRYTARIGAEFLIKGQLICVTTVSGLVGVIKIKEVGDYIYFHRPYIMFDLAVYQGVPPTPGG
jgi:serine/threonine protein kinase